MRGRHPIGIFRTARPVTPGRAAQILQRGQGMTEYVIALVAIAVVSIAIVVTYGARIQALFGGADAEIASLTSGDLGGSGGVGGSGAGGSPDGDSPGAQPSGDDNDGSAGAGDDGNSGGGPLGSTGRGGGRGASSSSRAAAGNSRGGGSSYGSGAGSGSLNGSSSGTVDERGAFASGAASAAAGGESRDARDRGHKRADEEDYERSLFENPPTGEEFDEADPAINMLVSGIVGLVVLALAVIVRFGKAGGRG